MIDLESIQSVVQLPSLTSSTSMQPKKKEGLFATVSEWLIKNRNRRYNRMYPRTTDHSISYSCSGHSLDPECRSTRSRSSHEYTETRWNSHSHYYRGSRRSANPICHLRIFDTEHCSQFSNTTNDHHDRHLYCFDTDDPRGTTQHCLGSRCHGPTEDRSNANSRQWRERGRWWRTIPTSF